MLIHCHYIGDGVIEYVYGPIHLTGVKVDKLGECRELFSRPPQFGSELS
jgi:hypothetical protein